MTTRQRKIWSDLQIREIYNFIKSGLTAKEVIENHFPTISRQTVSSICKKFKAEEAEAEEEEEEEEEEEDEDEDEDDEDDEEASIASVESVKTKDFSYLPIVQKIKKQKVPEVRQPELEPRIFQEPKKEQIFQNNILKNNHNKTIKLIL